MSKQSYTDSELMNLINSIESEFSAHLAKAEQDLKKSEEAEEKAEEAKQEEPKAEAKEETKEEAKEDKAESKEETKEEAKEEKDHDLDEEDMEELEKMYHSMSKGEAKAHYEIMKKCMAKYEAPMAKSEEQEPKVIEIPVKNEDLELAKSEIEELKKSNEELKKNLESIVNTLKNKFMPKSAPKQKAVVNLEVLDKSEKEERPMQRHEVIKKLSAVSQQPTLTKSERQAINAYTLGTGSLDSIKHLLK